MEHLNLENFKSEVHRTLISKLDLEKLSGTRRSLMISLIMLDTAWRAWFEFTRDSFSRSSFEISVR